MSKLITYVFPVFNEEEGIIKFAQEIFKITKPLKKKYELEFIFINDGSVDKSLEKLLHIQKRHNNVRVINFSRNFGHQIAITAGLDYAKGDAVIIMDADLQDPPEVSLELIKEWEAGYEVVYARRRQRKDSLSKRMTAFLFYRVLNGFSDIDIPTDTGDFRLVDRKVVDAIKAFREHNRFVRGLFSYVGFKQKAVLFDRNERYAGTTKYPLKKMMKLASDGIIGFSTKPLRIIINMGVIILGIDFILGFYMVIWKLTYTERVIPSWIYIIMIIMFLGAIQVLAIGILGLYIAQVFVESKNRPLYIVSQIYEN